MQPSPHTVKLNSILPSIQLLAQTRDRLAQAQTQNPSTSPPAPSTDADSPDDAKSTSTSEEDRAKILHEAAQTIPPETLKAVIKEAFEEALPVALQASLTPLIKQLEAKIDDLRISTKKKYNCALAEGRTVPFDAVPFPDGTLPSAQTNTPTALANTDIIESLSADELREYCTRYYPGRVYEMGADERTQRIKDIRAAIGCGVL
ncbi:hypothetical protein R3P38DRAFT_3037265 [Favolaschia claudopus]|uniref:Mug135-like C-terminal domain-containing protein n=1 Tax=Favolaschia claudopus TaxID=2862362 RepID=A0AAW0ABI1_9AGAR